MLASAVAAALYAHNAAAQPTRIMECRAEGLPEGQITAPGSYVLARNLSARGDCLVIEADFVTIDLAGFAITGNGTGTGIRADRVAIEVRNGTVTGFMTGVRVRGSAIIEGMRVIGNTGVGIDTSLQRSIVTGNVVRNNGDDGIVAIGIVNGNASTRNGGAGIVADQDSIVSGNTVTFNADLGIFFSRGSTIIGNTVAENFGDGITTTFAPASTVSGNTVRSNSENGIVSSSGTVSGNTVEDNGEDGIIAEGTVSGNTARGNGNFGIVIVCPSNVIGNTATGNSRNNIVLFGGAELCNTIDNLPRFSRFHAEIFLQEARALGQAHDSVDHLRHGLALDRQPVAGE